MTPDIGIEDLKVSYSYMIANAHKNTSTQDRLALLHYVQSLNKRCEKTTCNVKIPEKWPKRKRSEHYNSQERYIAPFSRLSLPEFAPTKRLCAHIQM